MQEMLEINGAGLLPMSIHPDGQTRGLFMIPSDPMFGGDKPQIAKGRIDPGESRIVTAIREAEEELGLKADNLSWIEQIGQAHDLMFYVCEVFDYQDFGKYCYETGSTLWLTEAEFAAIGRDVQRSTVAQAFDIARKRHASLGNPSKR